MATSKWFDISPTNTISNVTHSKEIALFLCQTFKSRAVIGNNGLGLPSWNKPGSDLLILAAYFMELKKDYGCGIYYQTAARSKTTLTNQQLTDLGIKWGASLIELQNTQKKILEASTISELNNWNTRMKNN